MTSSESTERPFSVILHLQCPGDGWTLPSGEVWREATVLSVAWEGPKKERSSMVRHLFWPVGLFATCNADRDRSKALNNLRKCTLEGGETGAETHTDTWRGPIIPNVLLCHPLLFPVSFCCLIWPFLGGSKLSEIPCLTWLKQHRKDQRYFQA